MKMQRRAPYTVLSQYHQSVHARTSIKRVWYDGALPIHGKER